MNFKSIIKKVDNKEVLTCILLIIVGYMTAQLFMRSKNGFRVGGQKCECSKTSGNDCIDGGDNKTPRNPKFCNDQKTKSTCLSAGGRIGPGKFLGKNTCKWTPGPPGPEPPAPGPSGPPPIAPKTPLPPVPELLFCDQE